MFDKTNNSSDIFKQGSFFKESNRYFIIPRVLYMSIWAFGAPGKMQKW